ncbi:MAG: hypothetical protein LBP99_03875 [Azoarcus sp.]|jgi:hypothetical protein|nr:hypothetical protein [Azoarcus sp.]
MFNLKSFRNGMSVAIFCFVGAFFVGCTTLPPATITKETILIEGEGVERSQSMRTPPVEDVFEKRIFIEFMDSPKATKVFQENLRMRGFQVVEDKNLAEIKYLLDGFITFSKHGERGTFKDLGPILESSIELKTSGNPIGNIGLTETIISSAAFGFMDVVSIFSLSNFLADITGLRGAINKLIAGDPRGFCWSPACDLYYSTAIVRVFDENGLQQWHLREFSKSKGIRIANIVPDVLDNVLRPIYDLAPKNVAPEAEPKLSPKE